MQGKGMHNVQERTRTRIASALTGAALIASLWAAGAAPVAATSLSPGCTELNDPKYDTTQTFGGTPYTTGSIQFAEGETVTVTGTSGGGPFTPQLYVYAPQFYGGTQISNQLGTTGEPISYTFTATASYDVFWGTDQLYYSTPSWIVECTNTPTTPPPADADNDGVIDADDLCASTVLPDTFANRDPKRYATDATGLTTALSGKKIQQFSMADLHGCSARQIAVLSGLGGKGLEKGLPLNTLLTWLAGQTI